MSFASPWFLLLLLPVLVLSPPWQARARPGVSFPPLPFALAVRPGLRRRLLRLLPWLRCASLCLLVICLARPRAGTEHVDVGARGIDIQLVLDVSSSMTRTDLAAGRTRLGVATSVIDRFVRGRRADRIGLLTFARYPRVTCPLTLDHDTLRDFLSRVRPVASNSEENTTAIGVALAAAALHLKEVEDRTRIVVLLTDGEEMEHDIEPPEAAELYRAYGIKLYTIAVAMRSGRWAREMKKVAEVTGGQGFVATDARALAEVYSRIDQLEKREIEETRVTEWRDLYPPLLFLLIGLLCGEFLLEALFLRRLP